MRSGDICHAHLLHQSAPKWVAAPSFDADAARTKCDGPRSAHHTERACTLWNVAMRRDFQWSIAEAMEW